LERKNPERSGSTSLPGTLTLLPECRLPRTGTGPEGLIDSQPEPGSNKAIPECTG